MQISKFTSNLLQTIGSLPKVLAPCCEARIQTCFLSGNVNNSPNLSSSLSLRDYSVAGRFKKRYKCTPFEIEI